MMKKKLFRSQTNKKLGGICGGLEEFFELDANFFRLGFVTGTLLYPPTAIIYGAAWLIIPHEKWRDQYPSYLEV